MPGDCRWVSWPARPLGWSCCGPSTRRQLFDDGLSPRSRPGDPPSLELANRRVIGGKREGSYANLLRRFQDILEAKTDQMEGVCHFLVRRFEELRREDIPAGPHLPTADQTVRQGLRPAPSPNSSPRKVETRPWTWWLSARGSRNWCWSNFGPRKSSGKSSRTFADVVLTLLPLDGTELPPQPHLDEFAKDLAEACEGLLAGFAEETTALEQFNSDVNEQAVRLDCLRTFSAPYLRCGATWQPPPLIRRLPSGSGSPIARAAVGEAFCQQVESGGAGHQLVGLQTFDLSDDSLMLYQEKTGVPLCYYQELEPMGVLYHKSLRIKETHFDYNALRGRLPEIRKVSSANQKRLAECLELSLNAIITKRLAGGRPTDRFQFYLTDEEFSVPVGDKLEDVVHYLANPDNEKGRAGLERQMEQWFLAARSKQEGQLLVLLWCALQDLHRLLLDRIQHQITQEEVVSAEARNHPVLAVVGQRMLTRMRVQVEGLTRGRQWLDSCLDRQRARELSGEEKRRWLGQRAELLRGCFEPATDDQPIPVIEENARLDLRFFNSADGDIQAARRSRRDRGITPTRAPSFSPRLRQTRRWISSRTATAKRVWGPRPRTLVVRSRPA